MCTNWSTNVGVATELTSNEMYEEIRNEWADNTISEETRDHLSSIAYKADNILSWPTDEDKLTKEEWAQEIRDEWANDTISEETRKYVQDSFAKVWRYWDGI